MNATDISFPNLGIYLKNVPDGFYIGNFKIALYGIIFAIGVLGGLMVSSKVAKEYKQDENTYWDFIIKAIIFSLIGARIYYIIFSWDIFFKDVFVNEGFGKGLLNLINLRNGGIAIYGAVIAAFIFLFIYCKIKKINPFIIGDAAMPGLILGQAIGRWGNFFNREVFGEYTNSFFAMRLPVDGKFVRTMDISATQLEKMSAEGVNYIQAHPTFLYESVCNLLVFALLMFIRKRKKFHGELCLLYFGGYGIARLIIEGIRTDQLKIGNTNIPVSQVVAIVLILIAVVGEVACRIMLQKGTLPGMFCYEAETSEETKETTTTKETEEENIEEENIEEENIETKEDNIEKAEEETVEKPMKETAKKNCRRN